MTTITWLHLSDWHQKGPDFDRDVVRDAQLRDIRERAKIDSSLAQVDFVVFSGDLAFHGTKEEYEAAQKHFLEPVLEAAGLKPDRLFCVPGNHDLKRDHVSEMLPGELQKPLTSDEAIQKWLTDEKRRTRALEPFEAYREAIAGYSGQDSPEYASLCRWPIQGINVALLGLNSAWMCARYKDPGGEVNDYGHALIGEPQLHDALAKMADASLRIAVLHHPFDWLAKFDRNRVEARLMQACHFILRGHEHAPQVQVVGGTKGECVVIPAGASYERRTAEDPLYTNAYNFVHLDFDAGRGRVYLRRWSNTRNAWIEDTDAHPGGQFPLKPLPKALSARKRARTRAARLSPPVADDAAARRQAAEQRYRDLMLETCDIINLTNLPEQDRHMAQKAQELKLRGLYIPLRVQVEASAGDETATAGGEKAVWKALEERRAAAVRGQADSSGRLRVPVGERLARARRLVVLGDPGAGKTTLTRWIATAYLLRLKQDKEWKDLPDVRTLPEADWLPIIVRCRELDACCLGGALDDILEHTLRKAELSPAEAADVRALLKERLKAGQALLMLDGLDEIADPAARARFCRQLEQIVVAYSQAPIIATSRIVGYREMGSKLGRGFEHLTLAELTREDKEDFAWRWCGLTEPPERRAVAAQELIHDIHSAERIERLTGNPMLLTTMALVKRKVGKLPNRRADLYGEAVQVLLNWRSDVDEPLDTREAIPQLEYLAYAMCDRDTQQLRQDEVLDLFARMRAEYPNVYAVRSQMPEEFLRRLEARTGILVEAGRVRHLGMPVPVYEFRHLTFQEYLAARALVDARFPGRDPARSLAAAVAPLAGRTAEMDLTGQGPETMVVESWREALRLCTAMCRDDEVDGVLRAILMPQAGEGPAVARARAILAGLCLADEPNASMEAVEQVLQTFAAQAKENGGWDEVRLPTLSFSEDGTVLVQAKETQEGNEMRTGLGVAAKELATSRWAGALGTTLVDEFCQREPGNRICPGGLAGMVGVVQALGWNKPDFGDWLAEQGRRLHGADEREAVEATLNVRYAASTGRAQLVPGLTEGLLGRLSKSAPSSLAAAWALAWLTRSPRSEKGPWQPVPDEIEALLAFTGNPGSDPDAVGWVVGILGQEKVERAFESLIFWLENSMPEVRYVAAQALGDIGSDVGVVPLIAHLDDSDVRVRYAATLALGNIKSEAAVAPLIARLDDGDVLVRGAAALALGNIKSDAAVAPLVAHLGDTDAWVRYAAAWTLGGIGSDAAIAPLVAHLGDVDSLMQYVAAWALGTIGNDAAAGPLIAFLSDADNEGRSVAARALGTIGNDAAVGPLIARLDDADAGVQRTAAQALGNIKSEAALAPLIARLDDADAEVRRTALEGLAQSLEEIDRKLLSRDIDELQPFLDPHKPIDAAFVQKAAEWLSLTPEEVRARYEALAERFHLRLEWRAGE